MQEVHNTLNSLNAIEIGFQKVQTGPKKRENLIQDRSETSSPEPELKQRKKDDDYARKTVDQDDRRDRKQDKKTDNVKETQKTETKKTDDTNTDSDKGEKEKFEKVLNEKTSETDSKGLEEISEEEIDEGIEELIQALMLITQEVKDDTNIEIDTEDHSSVSAMADLVKQFANDQDLGANAVTEENIAEIINGFLNSDAFKDLDLSDKLQLAKELNSLLQDQLEALKAKLAEMIKNIDLSNVAKETNDEKGDEQTEIIDLIAGNQDHYANQNDHDQFSLGQDLESRLEKIINLGDKSEAISKLQEIAEKLAEAFRKITKKSW